MSDQGNPNNPIPPVAAAVDSNLSAGIPLISDIGLKDWQKEVVDAFHTTAQPMAANAVAAHPEAYGIGYTPKVEEQRRYDLVNRLRLSAGKGYDNDEITDTMAEVLAQYHIQQNPKAFAEDLKKIREINQIYGTQVIDPEDPTRIDTQDTEKTKELTHLYLRQLYRDKLQDKVIPVSVLHHPYFTQLSPDDIDHLKNILVAADPELSAMQDMSWITQGIEYNAQYRELTRDLQEGKISGQDFLDATTLLNHAQGDMGMVSELGFSLWKGTTNIFQRYANIRAKDIISEEEAETYDFVDGSPNVNAMDGPSLGRVITAAQRQATDERYAEQFAATLIANPDVSAAELYASQEEERNKATAVAALVNYGTFFLGGPIIKLGGAATSGTLRFVLNKAAAARADAIMANALTKGAVELTAGTVPFTLAFQGAEAVSEAEKVEAFRKYTHSKETYTQALGRGFTENFFTNLAFGAAITGAFSGQGALYRAAKNRGKTQVQQVAQTVDTELSQMTTDPAVGSSVVNTGLSQLDDSLAYYVDARDLQENMAIHGIDQKSLTTEQQHLITDLDAKAAAGEDIVIPLGDFNAFYSEENAFNATLKELRREQRDGLTDSQAAIANEADAKVWGEIAENNPQLYTTDHDVLQGIIQASRHEMDEQLQAELHAGIANVGIKGLSSQNITQVAGDVTSFITGLFETVGVQAKDYVETFKAIKPKFAYVETELDLVNGSVRGKSKGVYNPEENVIYLRKDSDIVTLTHEVSHFYLETIMKLSDLHSNNATLKAIKEEIVNRYGITGYKDWASLDVKLKTQIHEEFVHAYLMHRLDAAIPTKGGTTLPSKSWGALNRAITAATVKYQLGKQGPLPKGTNVLAPQQVHQAQTLAGQEFNTKYGFNSNAFSNTPIFSTLDNWSAREITSHRIAALNDVQSNLFDINMFRGQVDDALIERWQQTEAVMDSIISSEASRGSLVADATVISEMEKANLTKKLHEAIMADPHLPRMQGGVDNLKLEVEAQKDVVAKLKEKQATDKATWSKEDAAKARKELATEQAKLKESKANLVAAKKEQKTYISQLKDIEANLQKRLLSHAEALRKITAQTKEEFDKPNSKLRTRYDSVEGQIALLRQNPLPESELSGLNLSQKELDKLRSLGLVSDKITELTPEAEAIWQAVSRGELKASLTKFINHLPPDEYVAKLAKQRFNSKMRGGETEAKLQEVQRNLVLRTIHNALNIVTNLLERKVSYINQATGKRVSLPIRSYYSKQSRLSIGNIAFNNSSPQQLMARAQRAWLDAMKALHNSLEVQDLYHARSLIQAAYAFGEMAVESAKIGPRIEKEIRNLRTQFSRKFSDLYDHETLEAAYLILNRVGLAKRPGLRTNLEQIKRYNPEAADFIDRIMSAPSATIYYKNMTNGDLLLMIDTIKNIVAKARENKAKAAEADAAIAADKAKGAKTSLKGYIAANKAAQQRLDELGVAAGGENVKTPSKKQELKDAARLAGDSTVKVGLFCQALDGRADGGPVKTFIYDPMRKAQTLYNAASNKLAEIIAPFIKKLDKLDKGFDKNVRVVFVADSEAALKSKNLPKMERILKSDSNGGVRRKLIGYMLHMGTDENFEALARGLGMERETLLAQIRDLEQQGIITKEMWEICQGIWNAYKSTLPDAQKACRAIEGHYFNEIPSRKVVSRYGEYEGGYVPISYVNREIKTESITDLTNNFNQGLPQGGFTKDRTVTYYEIDSTVEAALRGVDEQLKYAHLLPAANEVLDLVRRTDSELNRLLNAVRPDLVKNVIEPWLVSTARQSGGNINPALRTISRWGSRFNASVLTLSLANAIQQFSGMAVAAVRVSPVSILWSMARTNPLTCSMQEISSKSLFMRTRFEVNRKNMRSLMQEAHTKSTIGHARDWLDQHGYILQTLTQRYVDSVVWKAKFESAYNKLVKTGMDPKHAEAQSIREADEIVRSTQGTFDIVDASVLENSPWSKIFLPFSNYFVTMANLQKAEMAIRSRNKQHLFTKMASNLYVLSLVTLIPTTMATAMAMAMKGKFFDDNAESSDLMMELGPIAWLKTFASQVNPLVGSVFSGFIDMIFNDKFTSNTVLSPPITTFGPAVFSGVKNIVESLINGKEIETRDLNNAFKVLAFFLTIAPNAAKIITTWIEYANGDLKGSDRIDTMRALLTGTKSPNQK